MSTTLPASSLPAAPPAVHAASQLALCCLENGVPADLALSLAAARQRDRSRLAGPGWRVL